MENETQNSSFFYSRLQICTKEKHFIKGEEFTEGSPKKTTIRNEYFYHFNDDNQIFQIDYQTADLATKYNYDSNALDKRIIYFEIRILSLKIFINTTATTG